MSLKGKHQKINCRKADSFKVRLAKYPKEVVFMVKSIVIIVAITVLVAIAGIMAIAYIFKKNDNIVSDSKANSNLMPVSKKDAEKIMDLLESLDDLNNSN